MPPGPALESAATALIALLDHWDARAASGLLANPIDASKLEHAFAKLSAAHGQCQVGSAVESDGKSRATFTLSCRERPPRADGLARRERPDRERDWASAALGSDAELRRIAHRQRSRAPKALIEPDIRPNLRDKSRVKGTEKAGRERSVISSRPRLLRGISRVRHEAATCGSSFRGTARRVARCLIATMSTYDRHGKGE
jgi:hypothetical protein